MNHLRHQNYENEHTDMELLNNTFKKQNSKGLRRKKIKREN